MIKLKKLVLEKTLYHGTLIDNVGSIERYGLMPSIGKFVSNAYGGDVEEEDVDEYLKELVFATDKEQLDKAVTAITAQIGYKLGKSFHEVTDDEFVRYGAIVMVYDGDSVMSHNKNDDENWYKEHPSTVEPGDYYSEDYVGADDILTGNLMIRLLKRQGVWPRTYTNRGAENIRWLRSELIRLVLKHVGKQYGDDQKEYIIKTIIGINDVDKLKREINNYKSYL